MSHYTVSVIDPSGGTLHVLCDNGIDCEEVIQAEARRAAPMTLLLLLRKSSGGKDVTVDRWAVEKSGRLVRAKRPRKRT